MKCILTVQARIHMANPWHTPEKMWRKMYKVHIEYTKKRTQTGYARTSKIESIRYVGQARQLLLPAPVMEWLETHAETSLAPKELTYSGIVYRVSDKEVI